MTDTVPHSWEDRFREALAAWEAMSRAPVPAHWSDAYAAAAQDRSDLLAKELWTTGSATLLGAIGLRRSEVVHSAALAWLLDPSGAHRLNDRVLSRLVAEVGHPPMGTDEGVTVRCEVPTVDPRTGRRGSMDIVVRHGSRTIVIENKLWSPETNDQLDRYAAAMEGRTALVYLTPFGAGPRRSIDENGRWRLLSWHDVMRWIEDATRASPHSTRAVQEYLSTLHEEFP